MLILFSLACSIVAIILPASMTTQIAGFNLGGNQLKGGAYGDRMIWAQKGWTDLPSNGLPISRCERGTRTCQNGQDLARAAVGCMGGLGGDFGQCRASCVGRVLGLSRAILRVHTTSSHAVRHSDWDAPHRGASTLRVASQASPAHAPMRDFPHRRWPTHGRWSLGPRPMR